MTDLLAAAASIGDAICATALWNGERTQCNWVGRIDEPAPEGGSVPATSALPPQTYAGSLGVALFLAELWAFTGDERHAATARGALRRSADQLIRRPPPRNLVLSPVAGTLGIVSTALRMHDLGFGDEVLQSVPAVLDLALHALDEPHQLDLLGGNAGAIPLFLSMAARPGYEQWHDVAIRCGDELLATGVRTDGMLSWEAKTASEWSEDAEPLAGYSHGASGFALALLTLHAATGRADFGDAGLAAFAYEESRWDEAQSNYIYVRFMVPGDPATRVVTTQMTWCHGSPGVAAARLRASQIDAQNAELHRAVARKTLRPTMEKLETMLEDPRADACLCHGISGLSEVLLHGARVLGDDECAARAARAASILIERHGAANDWPSGVPSRGPNPGLFVGSAGVGHHFLRQHAPDRVPPVLL